MTVSRLPEAQHRKRKALFESYYRKGYSPPGHSGGVGFSLKSVAVDLGITAQTLGKWYREQATLASAGEPNFFPDSALWDQRKAAAKSGKVYAVPARKEVLLLTSAQDETAVDQAFFKNLMAYRGDLSASLFVGGFTYQKGLFEDHAVRTAVFAPELQPYLRGQVVELAPRLVWYGKANILPTAADPLVGWDTQTKDKWGIFPHAKIALKSIPTMPGAPGKQNLTTGCLTVPNYVQKNAGQKAEHHHSIGATVVEIAVDGTFFCRQIIADTDGSFQDLDVVVRDGKLSRGNRVEALVYGDIHVEQLDWDVARTTWGIDETLTEAAYPDALVDALRPHYQIFHDSFDFTSRSHHSRNDPHERTRRLTDGHDSVQADIRRAARFLQVSRRNFATSVHVASNHNLHLDGWLKDKNGLHDAANAGYWCELNAAMFRAIERGDDLFQAHEYALRREGDGLDSVVFLREGQSFQVCQTTHPVELGLHGHIGTRGAKGSVTNLSKIVPKTIIADKHEFAIRDGLYVVGTSSRLDMRYAIRGPGAWQHGHGVVYPNGKRALLALQNGRYRA